MRSAIGIVTCSAVTSLALAAGCARAPRTGADLIVTHGKVWTGVSTGTEPAEASAVAVVGDRVVDVGTTEAIERWRGPGTTEIDAGGRRVVPGFNDAHVHFLDGGTQLENVDLKDAPSQVEFARRIGERAKANPGEWILGGN